jgi:putative permease
MNAILAWLRRQLADPQIVALTLIVLLLALSVWLFGKMLAPLLASLVIAYLLDSLATRMRRPGVPHVVAVCSCSCCSWRSSGYVSSGCCRS